MKPLITISWKHPEKIYIQNEEKNDYRFFFLKNCARDPAMSSFTFFIISLLSKIYLIIEGKIETFADKEWIFSEREKWL